MKVSKSPPPGAPPLWPHLEPINVFIAQAALLFIGGHRDLRSARNTRNPMQRPATHFSTLLIALCGALLVHAAVVFGLLHSDGARPSGGLPLNVFTVMLLPDAVAPEDLLPAALPEEVFAPAPASEPSVASEPVPESLPPLQPVPVANPTSVTARPKPKEAPRTKGSRPPPQRAVAGSSSTLSSIGSATLSSSEPYLPPRGDAAYLHNPRPAYPRQARQQRMQGRVLLEVQVSAEGDPVRVALRSSSGFALLDQAATEAVSRWRFVPAHRAGRAVEALVEVPIRFALTEEN